MRAPEVSSYAGFKRLEAKAVLNEYPFCLNHQVKPDLRRFPWDATQHLLLLKFLSYAPRELWPPFEIAFLRSFHYPTYTYITNRLQIKRPSKLRVVAFRGTKSPPSSSSTRERWERTSTWTWKPWSKEFTQNREPWGSSLLFGSYFNKSSQPSQF